MITQAKLAALAGNWTARLIGIGIVIAAVIWFASSFIAGQSAKTDAKLKGNQVEAAVESGQDAVQTVGDQSGREDDVDAITRENDDDIRTAEGADAPVSANARAAGKRSLCKRAAYRERPECLQQPAAE